jgi:hypothetical protein
MLQPALQKPPRLGHVGAPFPQHRLSVPQLPFGPTSAWPTGHESARFTQRPPLPTHEDVSMGTQHTSVLRAQAEVMLCVPLGHMCPCSKQLPIICVHALALPPSTAA